MILQTWNNSKHRTMIPKRRETNEVSSMIARAYCLEAVEFVIKIFQQHPSQVDLTEFPHMSKKEEIILILLCISVYRKLKRKEYFPSPFTKPVLP